LRGGQRNQTQKETLGENVSKRALGERGEDHFAALAINLATHGKRTNALEVRLNFQGKTKTCAGGENKGGSEKGIPTSGQVGGNLG